MLTNVESVAVFLEEEVKSFTDIAVVGISGGVDSAVVASIAVAALGARNVYALSMPYDDIDSTTFNARSAELADKLGCHHKMLSIRDAVDATVENLQLASDELGSIREPLHRLTTGNTRSRIRMTYLYGLAGELTYRMTEVDTQAHVTPVRGEVFDRRVRVLGTGNASEDLIGYDTKGGDALADLFVIGDLFKSEVYQLAKYYQVPTSIVEAPPSAGLYDGQTDQDELGYTYEELEPALAALHECLASGCADEELSVTLPVFADIEPKKVAFVVNRFLANAHKHRAPKVINVRHTDFVKNIWKA